LRNRTQDIAGPRRIPGPHCLYCCTNSRCRVIEAEVREAESAFGDATVLLEHAVINPRHIEVQILTDTHGNVIHLYERYCSVQRCYQKVLELAPAPNLAPELRDKICADAVAFARHIGYTCVGTVRSCSMSVGSACSSR
jgi:pyruvate carboxylase